MTRDHSTGWDATASQSCRTAERTTKSRHTNKRAVVLERKADVGTYLALKLEAARLRAENLQLREAAAESAVQMLEKIVGTTTALFGCEVSVVQDSDPEFPDHKYYVFTVEPVMDVNRVLRAERDWAAAIRRLAPTWRSARLSILPRVDDERS